MIKPEQQKRLLECLDVAYTSLENQARFTVSDCEIQRTNRLRGAILIIHDVLQNLIELSGEQVECVDLFTDDDF
jgi:hypothetical protein